MSSGTDAADAVATGQETNPVVPEHGVRQVVRNAVRRLYRELMPLLYGKSNYKLFLQRSFLSLDRRTAAILCSSNVLPGMIRPVPISAPFGKSMLVVAPHQDDELIGCGGAMILQRRAGRGVHVVFTQDGGDEHIADGRTRDEQIAIREAEARAVAQAMGIPEPRFLRSAILTGSDADRVVDELRAEIDRLRVDAVFVPFFLDYNYHHQLTNYILAEALSAASSKPQVFGYEVWGLTVPNVVLNIDEAMEEKRRLLALYPSQMSGKDYIHGVTGLNMFHSLHFGAGDCRYAERFFEMPAAEYIETVRAIRKRMGADGARPPGEY
jgi:N-acetylglucosamine malate deacetylase 1